MERVLAMYTFLRKLNKSHLHVGLYKMEFNEEIYVLLCWVYDLFDYLFACLNFFAYLLNNCVSRM